jgi:hypothetical protein
VIRKPLLTLLGIIFFIAACTKIQTTDIGSGLIPPIDGVITKDTIIDLVTNTFLEEEIARVYKSDNHVIGVIENDPLFGKTNASVYMELKPPAYKFSFQGKKEDLIVDSAVLIMSYKGAYGDTTLPQTWRVFEINNTNPLKYDSNYGTNTANIGYGAQLGIKSNFDLRRLGDSVYYGFEKAANQIRIKLNNSFADRMIKQYDSSNAYSSDSAFKQNFAGFAVVPDGGSGNALIKINLVDTNTKLALFYSYKGDGATKRDTTVSYFRFITQAGALTSGSANIIKRDRNGFEIAGHLGKYTNDSLVYVQTSPGSYVRVKVPGLELFPNSLIHRAELIAEQVPHNFVLDEKLSPPRYLLLSVYDSVNKIKRNIPNDYALDLSSGASNIATFGGFLTYKTIGATRVASYDFNLTRYVQGIVSRKDTSHLLRISAPSNDSLMYKDVYPSSTSLQYYIVPGTANEIATGRVRLGGGIGDKTKQYRMRLRIIYSKL